MKKLLLSLAFAAVLSFSAKAQCYLGGNVGFSVKASESALFTYQILPEVGYNINDKFAVGGSILLGGTVNGGSTFNFSVNPYFRWNFAKAGDVIFFADTVVGLGTNSTSLGEGSGSFTQFAWSIAFAPGLSFDISKNLGFVAHFASIGVSGIGSEAMFDLTAISGPSVGLFYKF